MVHAYLLAILALSAALACDGERRLPGSSPAGARLEQPAADSEPGAAGQAGALSDTEVATEAVARAVLAERFRAAGFRVRHDVAVARPGSFEVTVDGYDPGARVGFEYVAAIERDTDLDAPERAALEQDAEHRILIIDAAPVSVIEDQAARFLGAHANPAASTD